MNYPSEKITRNIILYSLQYLKEQPVLVNKVTSANSENSSNIVRANYFLYGALLFTTIGVGLFFISVAVTMIGLAFFKWLDYSWFFVLLPGFIFFVVGGIFSSKHKESSKANNTLVTYTTGNLCSSIFIAVIMVLFILLILIPI